MNKVLVIGCPGSGKSTFSRALQQVTDLPLFHLDMLYWNPDGTAVPKKTVFQERLRAVMSGERWIIDGNYGSTMELRMASCDTVIFLDYPAELCLEGIEARKGKPRPDMPWKGSTEDEDEEFIAFINDYAAKSPPKGTGAFGKVFRQKHHHLEGTPRCRCLSSRGVLNSCRILRPFIYALVMELVDSVDFGDVTSQKV